jgi:hypothetical protein
MKRKILIITGVLIALSIKSHSQNPWTSSGGNVYLSTITDNVGIGTSTPLAKLQIQSAWSSSIYYPVVINNPNNTNTTGYGVGLKFRLSNGSTDTNKYCAITGFAEEVYGNKMGMGFKVFDGYGVGNFEAMRIKYNGYVGIGTTNPQIGLQIEGTSWKPGIMLNSTDPSHHWTGVIFQDGGTSKWYIGADVNADNTNNFAIYDYANNSVNMYFASGGKVGIGTTSPAVSLDVVGRGVFGTGTFSRSSYGNTLSLYNAATTNTSLFLWQAGTGSAHIGMASGESLLRIVNSTSDGSLTNSAAIVLDATGKVGIGTTSPAAKLDIQPSDSLALVVRNGSGNSNVQFYVKANGYMIARDIQVKTGTIFPDYVFEKDYQLASLDEIEKYINEHKHLPDVPSANEIENSGLNVAEMDATLLKKIEELTLYVIELKKQNEAQQTEIELLKEK